MKSRGRVRAGDFPFKSARRISEAEVQIARKAIEAVAGGKRPSRERPLKCYHFKIHRAKSGYWAECVELKGCRTQGDTLGDLRRNMREALILFLDEPKGARAVIVAQRPHFHGRDVVQSRGEVSFGLWPCTLRAVHRGRSRVAGQRGQLSDEEREILAAERRSNTPRITANRKVELEELAKATLEDPGRANRRAHCPKKSKPRKS